MSQYYPTKVPYEGPAHTKILLVGEAPGEQEVTECRPFVGQSGELLMNVLGRIGLMRSDVRLANLCQYRPYGNKFELLLNSDVLVDGLSKLAQYIRNDPPHLIVALGRYPLKYLTGKDGIDAWRGSILECTLSGCEGIKVVATFHPAYVLRDRTAYPIFDQDLKRCLEESQSKEIVRPERSFIIDPHGTELIQATEELCESERLAIDIESVKGSTTILCVGFSPTPHKSVCIPNNGTSSFISTVGRILSSPAKKVFHFGTFDTEMLRLNGLDTHNYWWDTMVAQHVMWPELPRSLAYLTSIHTREPYYKSEGRATIPSDTKSWGARRAKGELYIYNCKDTAVTAEIQLAQEAEINREERILFDLEMRQLAVANHISQSGMPLDLERRELFRRALLGKWYKMQSIIDLLAGEKHVNVKSPKLKDLIYGKYKLPVRKKRTGQITLDEDAIVSLITYCTDYIDSLKRAESITEWKTKLYTLKLIIEIRSVRQLLSNYIAPKISADGRIRSTYKVSSTETGRWAAESYVDGTGINSQTFPRESVEVPENLDDLGLFNQLELALGAVDDDDETTEDNVPSS